MSYKTDFKTFLNTWIKQNGQNLITGDLLNEALSPWLADRVVWADDTQSSRGFSGKWKLAAIDLSTPSAGEFTTSSTDVGTINDGILIHRKSIDGVDFGDTLNKLSGVLLANSAGLEVVLPVVSVTTSTDYVTLFVDISEVGTLTDLTLDAEYTMSFLYGEAAKETVTSYFCTSFGEVNAAVLASNAGNGGNIYISGAIYVEERSWDLTGINFIGGTWKFLNQDSVTDGGLAERITITAGNPTFTKCVFNGSGGGSQAQLFSGYSSRKIFKVDNAVSSTITFNDCGFNDIIGGAGTNPVIEYTTIPSLRTARLDFNGCTITSHNNNTAFTMNGLSVSVTSLLGDLLVSAVNQKLPLDRAGLAGTDLKYVGDISDPSKCKFYTDGTANGGEDFTGYIDDAISILENNAGVLAGSIMFRDPADGVIKNMTLTQLKTLILA